MIYDMIFPENSIYFFLNGEFIDTFDNFKKNILSTFQFLDVTSIVFPTTVFFKLLKMCSQREKKKSHRRW